MREWFTCLRYGHKWEFSRTVYGDELRKTDARSLWVCAHCKQQVWAQRQAPARSVAADGKDQP